MKMISPYLDSQVGQNFTIHEVDMKLIPEHRSKIKFRLESLELRSPAIASILLIFTAEQEMILGELTINGSGRRFRAKRKGKDPWAIYRSLEKEIDQQLNLWKKTRFVNDYAAPLFPDKNKNATGGYAL